MLMPVSEKSLRLLDYLLLGLYCIALFGFLLVPGPVLTGHESVLPENAREMLADHDWLIPKMGGEPWLERPPLPDWILAATDWCFGQSANDRVVRIAPILLATAVVLLLAWMAAKWFGRAMGLLSGLILATMYEFFSFSTDPEADMFLCTIVTCAMALFVKLEFGSSRPVESDCFFGRRPWTVLAFFVFFGLTNMAKGLIFGTLMVAVPVAGFLLWNADLKAIRRYVWFWGWLAFAVVSLAWPVIAYLQHPEIRELWEKHYLGRLSHGYIGEPPWYYLGALPYVVLPWSIPALVGLWLTKGSAWRGRSSPERFVWCWAILTPVFFSIPDGKHHHYLLHCMAPWAVLGAFGAVRMWQWFLAWPTWLRNPALSLPTLGLAGDVAVLVFRHSIPGPAWLAPTLLLAWPLFAFACCWALGRSKGQVAVVGTFACLFVFYSFLTTYQTLWLDDYQDDRSFLREARALVERTRPVFINDDMSHPLETAWLLFYSDDSAVLVSDMAALFAKHAQDTEVYLVARMRDEQELLQFGSCDVVLQSKHTRGEQSLSDRRTLFRVRPHDALTQLAPQ